MTIILGFVFPILLFLVTIPLKAAIKLAQSTLTQGDSESSILDRISSSPEVKGTKKVVNVAKKAAVYAAKRLIRIIKFIIGLIKAVVLVIQTLVALGIVGLILAIVMLIAAAAGAVLFMMMVKEDMSSNTGSIDVGTTVSDSPLTQSSGYSKWFWVGDSRTVGMASAYGVSPTSDGNTTITDTYCAKVGMGLDWFLSDEVKETREKIYAMTQTNIVFNLGVNDLGNIDKYVNFYTSLPEDFIKNNKIIVMAINPVTDSKTAYVDNSAITPFNDKLKSSLPAGILFVDTYKYMMETVDTDDDKTTFNDSLTDTEGLHYSVDTYKALQEYVKSQITPVVTSEGTNEGAESPSEETTN